MKNKMMKTASCLMVAVLLTTNFVSGTYAKYVTENSGSDGARVAKWGVKINTKTTGLFSHSYANTDKVNGASEGTAVSVTSIGDTNDHVVAPGTSGSTTLSLSGTPEVAVDVKFMMNVESDVIVPVRTQLSDNRTLYESYTPVKFTLTDSKGTELASGTLNDIKTVFNGLSGQYAPNKNLSETYTITWDWPINGDNEADTYLGNVASGSIIDDKTTTGIKFNYSVTVTQID